MSAGQTEIGMESAAAWTTTTTIREIAERLRRAQRVAILTHAKPDGDALGCSLALARTLGRIGKHAVPVFLDPWSPRFDAILADTPVVFEKPGWQERDLLRDIDTVVIVDTGSWSQVGAAREWLEARKDCAIVVDHHPHGHPDIAPMRLIDTDAAAAAEIIADLCRELLGLDSPADLPLDVAEPLYLGIATDTGWFRYSNLRSGTLRLAADLIEAGVDANRLFRETEQADEASRLRIMARALASIEFHDEARFAIMSISHKDLQECGATIDEVGGLTDMPQTVGSVKAVAMLYEIEPGLTKVSLRSKAGEGSIDVSKVAQRFGGGGHVHAAGVKLDKPIDEARRLIAQALSDAPTA